jgi:hypothetical protein
MQMNQRWQMQNRYGMMGQRGRGQQGGPGRGQGGNCYLGQGSASAGQLTQQDAEHILLMREEEKLARDVYLTLGEKWNVPVFKNIAQAEARHMSVMKMLVDRYRHTASIIPASAAETTRLNRQKKSWRAT